MALSSELESRSAAGSEFAEALEALRAERPPRNPRLHEAERAIRENRLAEAGEILSRFLENHPADTVAMHLMAETALRTNRREEAETLLAQCLALAPDFAAARYNYANALAHLNKPAAALAQLQVLLKHDPRNLLYRNLKATVL